MTYGIYPTQGKTLAFRGESALGTGNGTLKDIRHTEPTFPTNTRTLIENPNSGHAHSYNLDDHGIEHEMVREGALSFSTEIRGPATPGDIPPIVTFFQSAGCNVADMTGDTTISDVAAAVDEFDLGDDYGVVGQCMAVELADSKYFPCLTAAYAASAVTPSMALPTAPADSAVVANMYTITPASGAIGATDSLEFVLNTRGTQTANQDLSLKYNGCACSAVGELSIKPNEAPKLAFTFNVGSVDEQSDAIAAESFADAAKMAVTDYNFEAAYAAYDMAGGITRACYAIEEVKFNWGFKVIPINSAGCGNFKGIQGYMQIPDGKPTLTVTGFYDNAWATLLENQGDNYKYFHFVQPAIYGEGNESAWGLWLPKCRLDGEAPVVHDVLAENCIKSTTTWICSAEAYTGTTIDSNAAAAPWYFGILHGTMA